MSYGVSDHKPVVASFSLEVGDNSLGNLPALMGAADVHLLALSCS